MPHFVLLNQDEVKLPESPVTALVTFDIANSGSNITGQNFVCIRRQRNRTEPQINESTYVFTNSAIANTWKIAPDTQKQL